MRLLPELETTEGTPVFDIVALEEVVVVVVVVRVVVAPVTVTRLPLTGF